MPDLNDVVRHVILRIVVDQEGLAESLAAAKAKLKALQDAEKSSNKDRVKDADTVTQAIGKQTEALDKNRAAHDAAHRSAEGNAKSTADAHKQATAAITDETKAVEQQTVAEAKAAEIQSRTNSKRLEEAAKRRRYNQETRQLDAKGEFDQASRETTAFNDARQRIFDQRAARKAANAEWAADLDVIAAKAKKIQADAKQGEERARNTRMGGQVDRTNKLIESTATVNRKDTDAEAKRVQDARKADEAITAKQEEAGQRIYNRQRTEEEKLHSLRTTNADKEFTKAEANAAALADLQDDFDKKAERRGIVTPAQIRADLDKAASASEVAKNQGLISGNRASQTGSVAQDTEAQRVFNLADRTARADERAVLAKAQTLKLEAETAKITEARTKLTQQISDLEARAARRSQTTQGYQALITNAKQLSSAFLSGALRKVEPDDDAKFEGSRIGNSVSSLNKKFRESASAVSPAKSAVAAFFDSFKTGEVAVRDLSKIRRGLHEVREEAGSLKNAGGSTGLGGFYNALQADFKKISDGITRQTSSLGRILFSFRGIIVGVAAAFGPLAAIVGSLGATALGLASDFGALSGVFVALPGILGAAVAGFGALALVLKPLTNVISEYTAAQKEAITATADGTTAAATAALNLRDAQLGIKEAQLASTRADQDATRAVVDLADARKDAARKIQDYRLALQKLKYDEESALLGVDTSEEAYRRALADPTATNLDRKVARNAVEGALFDKRDQAVSEQRTKQDAAEAEAKGVEGSDEVVSASRALQDAANNIEAASIAYAKAQNALKKAQLEKVAGGTAAAQLQADLDRLPPATRKVAQAILDLIKGPYKTLRSALSENIFGPLAKDTNLFGTALAELHDYLTPASEAIGTLLDQAIKLLTNPDWTAFFKGQGGENKTVLLELGGAALDVADGFRAIITAARPFTREVVDAIAGGASSFDKFFNSAKGFTGLQNFLLISFRTFKEFVPILKNFGSGIAGIFAGLNDRRGANGAQSFTDRINNGILGISKQFKKFGDEARDPNGGFQTWLRNVGPLIKDVAKFVGAVGTFFGDLFKNPANLKEADKLLSNLAQKWLPTLAEIFDHLSQSGFISKIAGGIGDILSGFERFLDSGGSTSLSVFADLLETFGKLVNFASKFEPLTKALALLSVVVAGIAGAALLAKFTKIFEILKGSFSLAIGLGKLINDPKGTVNKAIDKITGRDAGLTTAKQNAKAAGAPIDRTGTGGVVPHLSRIELLLKDILAVLEGGSSGGTTSRGGGTSPTGGSGGTSPKGGPSSPRGGSGGSTGGGSPGTRTESEDELGSGLRDATTATTKTKRRYRRDIVKGLTGLPTIEATGDVSNILRDRPSRAIIGSELPEYLTGKSTLGSSIKGYAEDGGTTDLPVAGRPFTGRGEFNEPKTTFIQSGPYSNIRRDSPNGLSNLPDYLLTDEEKAEKQRRNRRFNARDASRTQTQDGSSVGASLSATDRRARTTIEQEQANPGLGSLVNNPALPTAGEQERYAPKNSAAGMAQRRTAVEDAREARLNPPVPERASTRGNNLTRSERIDRAAQARGLVPEALEEDRRRDADAGRNNRPGAGSTSAAAKRRATERERYNRRNASLTEAPGKPDLPILASDLDETGTAIERNRLSGNAVNVQPDDSAVNRSSRRRTSSTTTTTPLTVDDEPAKSRRSRVGGFVKNLFGRNPSSSASLDDVLGERSGSGDYFDDLYQRHGIDRSTTSSKPVDLEAVQSRLDERRTGTRRLGETLGGGFNTTLSQISPTGEVTPATDRRTEERRGTRLGAVQGAEPVSRRERASRVTSSDLLLNERPLPLPVRQRRTTEVPETSARTVPEAASAGRERTTTGAGVPELPSLASGLDEPGTAIDENIRRRRGQRQVTYMEPRQVGGFYGSKPENMDPVKRGQPGYAAYSDELKYQEKVAAGKALPRESIGPIKRGQPGFAQYSRYLETTNRASDNAREARESGSTEPVRRVGGNRSRVQNLGEAVSNRVEDLRETGDEGSFSLSRRGEQENRPSRTSRLLKGITKPFTSGDDSGFVSLDRTPREEAVSTPRTRRASTSGGRVKRLGRGAKGLGGGLLGLLGAGALTGGSHTGDADYDQGYDDGLNAAGGGGLDPSQFLEDGKNSNQAPESIERNRRKGMEGEQETPRSRRGLAAEEESVSRSAGRGGRLSGLFRGAEGAAEGAGERGLLSRGGGLLARSAGGLARGLAGGLAGAALSGAVELGGDYLTNKYVKSGKDQGSLSRGLGAVAQGAGIGATIGSIIPGVGTVVGGAIGGVAGGAYSLLKDKNLRDFVGGKLEGGAKAVGGFFGGIGKGIGGLFGGDDKGGKTQAGDLKDTGLGGILSKASGPVGFLLGKTDIGKEVIGSLDKAGTKVADFFTKKIPDLFNRGVKGIHDFFTKTLPALPGKAFDAITTGFGVLVGFFLFRLPKIVAKFFTHDIPAAAKSAFNFVRRDLFDPFVDFIQAIPDFFTKTIPHWFETVAVWKYKHIDKPIFDFVTKKIPEFFTQTIPKWFDAAPKFFEDNVIKPVTDFFTVKIPAFFTVTLPDAIKALPGFLYDNLVQPILDFFKGIAGHVGDFLKGSFDWAKALFTRGTKNVETGADSQKKMSGGLITGVYQGIEDTARVLATPGEFYIRRSRVQQPGGQQFLTDFNEGRIDPSQFYAGLSAVSAPQVRSIVPPNALGMAGAVPSVVNTTVHQGLAMGDITINNPVREKSEHSLRRQIQIASIRHRR